MLSKSKFFQLATLFEGFLGLLALFLGQFFEIDPLQTLRPDLSAFLIGIAGTIPLYYAFMLTQEKTYMRPIRDLLVDRLGPILATCAWYETLYLGLLAGVTEELLFRGFLQPWFELNWGWLGGLVFSNMIFALVHWITPLYAVLAAISGLYLGLSLDIGENRSLITPLTIHTVYDFLAFLAVARLWQQKTQTIETQTDDHHLSG